MMSLAIVFQGVRVGFLCGKEGFGGVEGRVGGECGVRGVLGVWFLGG